MGSTGGAGEQNGSRAEIGSTAGRGMGHSEVTLHCIPCGLAAYVSSRCEEVSGNWNTPGGMGSDGYDKS